MRGHVSILAPLGRTRRARGTCVAALRGVRSAILLPSLLATTTLAACNIGALGDSQIYQDKSPGTVTFRLLLPADQSFCDQLPTCSFGLQHLTFSTVSGDALDTGGRWCTMICSDQCLPLQCPPIACPVGGGAALADTSQSWTGAYYEPGTCGSQKLSCDHTRFVLPGRYRAHFCATPGTLSQGDAGPPTCTPSGPPRCADVVFDLPGPPTVDVALPAS